jgi:hypothetical protein
MSSTHPTLSHAPLPEGEGRFAAPSVQGAERKVIRIEAEV